MAQKSLHAPARHPAHSQVPESSAKRRLEAPSKRPAAPHPRTRKTERTCKKNAASLARNRKRLYLCTANEAGQGHSSAGLERFSHIEEVIGSNPIVPTSTAEPKRTHHQGAPAFSFHPYPPPAAARKSEIRNAITGHSQHGNWEFATRMANNKRKASSALPVCLQIREGVVLHRPTQGWTVEEASLLCQVSIYSLTVQPRVGRWRYAMHPPGNLNESCT